MLHFKYCSLQNTRIDIWQYPLLIEDPNNYYLLNQEESSRAKKYHFDHHRKRFIIAHTTLRLIIAQYCDIHASELIFKPNKYGKPELINVPKLQFNLSHSGDLALLAVGCDYQLGIDLEFFSARPYKGLSEKMFSLTEIQQLKNAPDAIKPLIFFNIWSQKEALIKACGMGLSYPTEKFTVIALPEKTQLIFDPIHNKTWRMLSFNPKVNCSAALCYNPAVTEIRSYKLAE